MGGQALKGVLRKGIELRPFDPTEFLDSEEAIAFYLEAAQEDGDPKVMEMALRNVERARRKNQQQKPAPHS